MCLVKHYINGSRTCRLVYKLVKFIMVDVLNRRYAESTDYRNYFRGKLNFPIRKELFV